MVLAGLPLASLKRLAARPVGDASTKRLPTASNNWMMLRTVVVFPVPGPPVSVQGDRVEVKMVAETPDGASVEVTFRGTVVGDEVKGDAEYRLKDDTGSFPFQAKRVS